MARLASTKRLPNDGRLNIRINSEQRRKLDDLAAALGMTGPDLCRFWIAANLREGKAPPVIVASPDETAPTFAAGSTLDGFVADEGDE
jgi:hypothetical protein